jgi:hypothetical protein
MREKIIKAARAQIHVHPDVQEYGEFQRAPVVVDTAFCNGAISGINLAMAAIESMGCVIVPKVATKYMIDIGACHEDQDHDIFDEGHIAHEVYKAMIEAGKV